MIGVRLEKTPAEKYMNFLNKNASRQTFIFTWIASSTTRFPLLTMKRRRSVFPSCLYGWCGGLLQCTHSRIGRVGGPVKSERLVVAKPGYICSRGRALIPQHLGT